MKIKILYSLSALILFFFLTASLQETHYKYNTVNGKYHYLSCKWAKKCTTNCIELTLKEIRDRGGIPCKVCKPPK